MHETFVLDTSIIVSWFTRDNYQPYADSVRKAIENGMRALTPATWTLDIAHKLIAAERRGLIKQGYIHQAINLLSQLPIRSDSRLPRAASDPAILTAQNEAISVYDATYLELALNKRLPLATIDERLRGIADKLGIFLFEQ